MTIKLSSRFPGERNLDFPTSALNLGHPAPLPRVIDGAKSGSDRVDDTVTGSAEGVGSTPTVAALIRSAPCSALVEAGGAREPRGVVGPLLATVQCYFETGLAAPPLARSSESGVDALRLAGMGFDVIRCSCA
jgi:hypothetical protein